MVRQVYCLLFLFVLSFSGFALAQTGVVLGTITNVDHEPISGAHVQLKGTPQSVETDSSGRYEITDVPPGSYRIEASANSYVTQTAQITVSEGQPIPQDLVLAFDLRATEELFVTGTTTPEKKIESSTSISSLSIDEINDAAPRTTTEFLRRVPGFTRVESSGGEVNENLAVRGLLGVSSVSFQEDGIPVYPTMDVLFMNADNLVRIDENLEKIEVLRSGSSPIFGSSTAGAIVNYLNKTGGSDLHGTVKGTGGTAGLGRIDFDWNGPLSNDWRFNTGGFYRYDRGVRNPGYTATSGGQLKTNVTRLLSNGFCRISLKRIDDRNLFILPLPFQNPEDPDFVPGFSETGSFYTKEALNKQIPLPLDKENFELPLKDGIRTKGTWLTGQIDFDFGNDWQFENIAQWMAVENDWNALTSYDVLNANEFAENILNNFMAFGLVPPGTTFDLLFTNHLDASGNKLPFDTANQLVRPGGLWHINKPVSDFSDQLTLRKQFGSHDFSFGSYFAHYKQKNHWYLTDVLTDVRDNPRFLDLVLVQPDGSTLDVTKNGFLHFLSFYQNADGNNGLIAFFTSDELKLSDRLRVDLGIRYELEKYNQITENLANFDLDGNPRTFYDTEVYGDQTSTRFESTKDDIAFSTGLNYQILPERLAAYGSFTRGFKLPALDEFLFLPDEESAKSLKPFRTDMYEIGMKYSSTHIALTGAFFYGRLFDFINHTVDQDPITGAPIFVSTMIPASTTWGYEFEVLSRVAKQLEFHSSATLVRTHLPEINQTGQFYRGLTPASLDLEISYSIYRNAQLLLDWHYVGQRFTNSSFTARLPDYQFINAGVSCKFSHTGFSVTGRILNLTQSKGLEEGNPLGFPAHGDLFLGRPILPRRITAEISYDF